MELDGLCGSSMVGGDFVVRKTNGLSTGTLHEVVIANIAWDMAYKRGVTAGAYIAQWSCNSIAIG